MAVSTVSAASVRGTSLTGDTTTSTSVILASPARHDERWNGQSREAPEPVRKAVLDHCRMSLGGP